ncbi:F-box protein At4g09920-like [Bidens hawaiensis]|uniref:F-box protein At4g09920-like n=1 Tax=Bidens hawaiensis TaxID=980011 RepID=UPI00404984BA
MSSIGENVHDRISMLPEEIVSQILSLMPTKYAVRTSILSKRWRYSWMLVTNLDFDGSQCHTINGLDSFSKFVDRVLKLCKSSRVKLFRLNVSKTWVLESSVSNWIDEAVRLNVCELDIQVMKFKLPLSMLTCKTLTKLRLNCSAYDLTVWYPSLVYFPCMITLDITIYNPFVNLFTLINGCPTLETLSLEVRCIAIPTIHYILYIPTLKQLKLTLPKCVFINKVVLHVPNLEYLSVGGVLSSIFVIEDVSSLVEASVSFSEMSFYGKISHQWVELIKGLSGVKSLSVKNVSFKHLIIDSNFKLLFVRPCFLLNHISSYAPTVTLLILSLILLLLLYLEDHINFTSTQALWDSKPVLGLLEVAKLTKYAWVGPKSVPACMLTNLTTIKLPMSEWWIFDIPFLKYMLGNSMVLKTLTVTWKYSNNVEEEARLCASVVRSIFMEIGLVLLLVKF